MGQLRERTAEQGTRLAAKDETIAELRRRAEAAEAARLAAERERDALRARLSTMVDSPQAAPAAPEAPTVLLVEGDRAPSPPTLWQHLRRALGRVC